jgi:TonB family protein
MKPTIALMLFLIPGSVFSQTDTVRKYFGDRYIPSDKENGWYVRVGYPAGNKWYAKEYLVAGDILYSEGYYTDASLQVPDGMFKFYSAQTYMGGGMYVQGKKTGSWQLVYDDGKRKDTAYYVNGIPLGASRAWYSTGKPMTVAQMDEKGNGTEKGLYENGKVEHSGNYVAGKKDGKWTYYYLTGKPSAIETMSNDSVIAVACFDEEGKPQASCGADAASDFPGGQSAWLRFLSKRASQAQYPPAYTKKQVWGTVVIQFVVDETGAVTNAEVIRSVHPALDAIALNIVRTSPKWQPAMQHNRLVKTHKKQPISFPKYPY